MSSCLLEAGCRWKKNRWGLGAGLSCLLRGLEWVPRFHLCGGGDCTSLGRLFSVSEALFAFWPRPKHGSSAARMHILTRSSAAPHGKRESFM